MGEIYDRLLESTSRFKAIGEARLELVFLTSVEFIYEEEFSLTFFFVFMFNFPCFYVCLSELE